MLSVLFTSLIFGAFLLLLYYSTMGIMIYLGFH
jgi:hypothetical protein